MSSSDAVNWQPIAQMRLIASMIDGALRDRSVRVHAEQLEFVDIYERQLRRWQAERPSAAQQRELDRRTAEPPPA